MLPRIRRFFDVRPGEGMRVLLSFLYVAVVVAAFLLARPIRNSLFLEQYGPYALVYVYAAVPLVLSLFVPVYTRIAARLGSRVMTVGTLVFFSSNALLFWHGFRAHPGAGTKPGSFGFLLPGMFYVWVNCFGAIAPVQAWTFVSTLFDTRQARRLFGLVGAGASLGAVTAGLLARFLVRPVGGTVNLLLVLAALILAAAGIVAFAGVRLRRVGPTTRRTPPKHPFSDSIGLIVRSPYLRLLAALVFLVAISTQWTAFQLSVVANARFGANADALTAFFGTFYFVMGVATFTLQLLLSGPVLRRFGVAVTIVILPLTLGMGSALILLLPGFWPVLLTNACDQGFRFSLDKSTYELLYLPLPPYQRGPDQGRRRHRRQPRRRCRRRGDPWRRNPRVLHAPRAGAWSSWDGSGQPGRDRRLVRRGLATAGRVRAYDSAEHSPASDRCGARVLRTARSVCPRGAWQRRSPAMTPSEVKEALLALDRSRSPVSSTRSRRFSTIPTRKSGVAHSRC